MRSLQMPLFWFVSFANEIKRIRYKTFCFDVRLGPNPCTQHIKCIHGAGCNSAELLGIHMSKFPPLLLRKWATIGSLSQNLFCKLQAKGEWLTILGSLKKKNNQGQWPQPPNKQMRCSYKLEMIYICGVHLGLLCQTSPGGLRLRVIPVFSIYISPCSDKALASRWPWSLFLSLPLPLCLHVQFLRDMCTSSVWYACMFNSRRICAQILYFNLFD